MTDLDQRLKELLTAESNADGGVKEPNFYREVWDSFHGQNASLLVTTWVGILVAGVGLIFCVIKMLQSTDTNELIVFASFAVMLNSAQIALKLWYNMRLNRSALLAEIHKLRLDVYATK